MIDTPWSKLIVKHADGVMLFMVYASDVDNYQSNKWQIRAKYRGKETDVNKINNIANLHINALSQNIIDTVEVKKSIDLIEQKKEYYKTNPKKSFDYESINADGIIKEIQTVGVIKK